MPYENSAVFSSNLTICSLEKSLNPFLNRFFIANIPILLLLLCNFRTVNDFAFRPWAAIFPELLFKIVFSTPNASEFDAPPTKNVAKNDFGSEKSTVPVIAPFANEATPPETNANVYPANPVNGLDIAEIAPEAAPPSALFPIALKSRFPQSPPFAINCLPTSKPALTAPPISAPTHMEISNVVITNRPLGSTLFTGSLPQ